jgi:murein L,D-transpeptidase YcbB/YkuD
MTSATFIFAARLPLASWIRSLGVVAVALTTFLPFHSGSAAESDEFREQILASVARRNEAESARDHLPALAEFYRNTDNGMLWVSGGTANTRARTFVEVLRSARDDVLDPNDYSAELLASRLDASGVQDLAYLEVNLSAALLAYTRHLSTGRVNPRRINEELAIDPKAPDPLGVLVGAKTATDMRVYATQGFEPQTPRYYRLRIALKHYRQLAGTGGWPQTKLGPLLKVGESDAVRIPTIRQRLIVSGYLEDGAHRSDTLDGALIDALKAFQVRHGLEVDGVAGPNTVTELNVTAAQRARQIELNMERRRWMEDDLGDYYVFVNLADQTLKVVKRLGDREKTVHTARTVVGKTYHRTPVFSKSMTYVVVNPSWNVPYSIAVNEFLPKLRRDPGVLAEDNFRLVSAGRDVDPFSIDWEEVTQRSFTWRLQQRPGDGNALGRIKFMFPNQFNVYIHDTPAKHLFARAQRVFSHGCVRVERPFELAEVLLARQGVTRERLAALRDGGTERVVSLDEPIPVHVHYITAWVNKDGTVHFRRDVYGRDELLDKALKASSPRPI